MPHRTVPRLPAVTEPAAWHTVEKAQVGESTTSLCRSGVIWRCLVTSLSQQEGRGDCWHLAAEARKLLTVLTARPRECSLRTVSALLLLRGLL